MSSIPSAAMPHATTMPSPVVSEPTDMVSLGERIAERARAIPLGAWAAGAATLGFAAAAATVATLRSKPPRPATRRRRTTAKARRKAA